MDLLTPSLALLIASSAPGAAGTPALRHARGSSVQLIVSARIVRSTARVGAGFAPPMPHMIVRRTTVSAADGRPVAALVYDFE